MDIRRWVMAAVLGASLVAPAAGGEPGAARAFTPADCRPRPEAFSVPRGARAVRFRLVALGAGTPCSGEAGAVAGFSIRRGGATVFLHYREASGRAVWDPVPLADLALAPGEYSLQAVPAAGASVALGWELEPTP